MLLSRKYLVEELTNKVIEMEKRGKKINRRMLNILTALFFHEMRHESTDPEWLGRDRLLISGAEWIEPLFLILSEAGYIPWGKYDSILSQKKSLLKPDVLLYGIPGVEAIAHSPDFIFTLANGLALNGKTARLDYRVYFITEAIIDCLIQELAHCSSFFKMDNLTAIGWGLQENKRVDTIHQWFSLGWHIEEVDFDDLDSILQGFSSISRIRGKPSVALG